MDSVKFGRVLGIGTRLAAKTVAAAVDAAASPNPRAAGASLASEAPPDTRRAESRPEPKAEVPSRVRKAQTKAKHAQAGIKAGGKRFGEAVWGPFVRLSGVLWLEFTGVFFGVFALFAGMGTWKMRGALHGTGQSHTHLLLTAGMAVLFTYFCASSFLRAGRRGRRR